MKKSKTNHFGIQRKIVASMTTESWKNIPHVTFSYEPDVTLLIQKLSEINGNLPQEEKISINTMMLRVITEGLKAAPEMNAHIKYSTRLVRGKTRTRPDVNISMPMIMPSGEMMTVNLRNFEKRNMRQMNEYICDLRRRIEKTDLNEAMMEVSVDNTFSNLRNGKVIQCLYRIIGSKTGKHRIRTLRGEAKKKYSEIPSSQRLTKKDLEPGTVTVSNIGSLYPLQRGKMCLLEIIPPQVTALALGAVQEKPLVVEDSLNKNIMIRKVLPICIAFDHRALDFSDIIPFLKKLDEIFENPEVLEKWI